MKRVILFTIILLFTINVFPQEDKSKNPSVELPDFVITGTEKVTIKKTQKIPPEFVPIISEAFIKPKLPPANLPVKNFSNPIKGKLDILDSLNFYHGYADFSAGRYLLPQGAIGLAAPFRYGMIDGYLKGTNQRAYLTNSERYSMDGGANVLLSINSNSGFLPGTQFKLHGNYGASSYKFFASDSSDLKRTLNNGAFSFAMNNFMSDNFNFSAKVYDDVTALNNEHFSEGLFGVTGFAKVLFEHFNIELNAQYKNQFVKSLGQNDSLWLMSNGGSYKFYDVQPAVGFNISNTIKTSIGINYSKSGDKNYFAPYAALGFRLNRGVLVFAEYNPKLEFLTSGNLLNQNDYFLAYDHINFLYKKTNAVNAVIKYEYGQYYQINAGFKYFGFENFPYFIESNERGKFDIALADGKSFEAFIDLLFHLGPYGVFYGTLEGSDVRDGNNHFIPYHPRMMAILSYGYEFKSGFGTKVKADYNSNSFADIQNNNEVNSFIDLGLEFSYKFSGNFKASLSFSNLLDHKNYKWFGYREKPLDAAAGVEFKW